MTGSHRSRALLDEDRSAALVRPLLSWLLLAPTTTSLRSSWPVPFEDCEPGPEPSGTVPPLTEGAPAAGACALCWDEADDEPSGTGVEPPPAPLPACC